MLMRIRILCIQRGIPSEFMVLMIGVVGMEIELIVI